MKYNTMTRNIILIVIVILAALLTFFVTINDYKQYVIMSLLVLVGIKGIIDFMLGLPMRVGFSGSMPNTKDHERSRLMLLILGIVMVGFGISWILIKLI